MCGTVSPGESPPAHWALPASQRTRDASDEACPPPSPPPPQARECALLLLCLPKRIRSRPDISNSLRFSRIRCAGMAFRKSVNIRSALESLMGHLADGGADVQRMWVEAFLRSYCEPGAHAFRPASVGRRWCSRCYKEEPANGAGCLICDAEARHQVQLHSPNAANISGGLCAGCYDGFATGPVGGWSTADDAS